MSDMDDAVKQYLSELGTKGGTQTLKRHGKKFLRDIGKLGGLKKAANYKAKQGVDKRV